ncbi:hypothetical protein [Neptuniibacter marinus]|uniref:hypothetical protein n=1 Tax=Neptuniibacter marinus TaxID=1806670 RepID=UPI000B1EACD7|nr:hypothetical protein [Neptuniibacter marinus]
MKDDMDVKKQACVLAKALIESDIEYLDKVIQLWKIGNSLYGQCWGTEFHVFGVIESDTDHLPTTEVREHCSASMLESSDKELKELIAFYRESVKEACNAILAKHHNV